LGDVTQDQKENQEKYSNLHNTYNKRDWSTENSIGRRQTIALVFLGQQRAKAYFAGQKGAQLSRTKSGRAVASSCGAGLG
jgi:hypothetical protein